MNGIKSFDVLIVVGINYLINWSRLDIAFCEMKGYLYKLSSFKQNISTAWKEKCGDLCINKINFIFQKNFIFHKNLPSTYLRQVFINI